MERIVDQRRIEQPRRRPGTRSVSIVTESFALSIALVQQKREGTQEHEGTRKQSGGHEGT